MGVEKQNGQKKKCIEYAKKYDTKKKYRKSLSYRATTRNKWLNEIYTICGFEISKSKPSKYWSKERCIIDSKNYKSLKDFRYNSTSAYCACAIRHNWIDEIKNIRKWD